MDERYQSHNKSRTNLTFTNEKHIKMQLRVFLYAICFRSLTIEVGLPSARVDYTLPDKVAHQKLVHSPTAECRTWR
jgi:hypothetical protein